MTTNKQFSWPASEEKETEVYREKKTEGEKDSRIRG